MRYIKFIYTLNIVFVCFNINAKPSLKLFCTDKSWNFIENEGQLNSKEIKYYGHEGNVYIYCRTGKISFVFTKVYKDSNSKVSEATGKNAEGQNLDFARIDNPGKVTISLADMVFLNSNRDAQIIASDKQSYYENFYHSNTPEEGITHVCTYKQIVYKDIYPNIDLVLYPAISGLKYEFRVYPGGNPDGIQIQWNGLENIQMINGSHIEYRFPLGSINEGQLHIFQGIKEIKGHFALNANRIGYVIGKYDKAKTLVIDPDLIWSTYFNNGEANGEANVITTDRNDYVYIAGGTYGNIFTTSGVFQSTAGNGFDGAFLAKFNSNGKILWSTYYGGNQTFVRCIASDSVGNTYLGGWSSSSTGIASSGGFQTNLRGAGNGFLAKFDSSGIRSWGTYFGDFVTNVGINKSSDYLCITGNTYSNSNNIATSGAYLSSPQGYGDAFLAKFSVGGKIQWSTYFGGEKNDYGSSVAIDQYGNIYMGGYTSSKSGIATKSSYQDSLLGTANIFFAEFTANDSLLWATYFGGNGSDYLNRIGIDNSGNIYAVGITSSTTGIATSGGFRTQINNVSESEDGFLAKFNSKGFQQWGTYYDEIGSYGPGLSITRTGNIFICGCTSSPTGIATKGAYQSVKKGYANAYLTEISPKGEVIWATYYGGTPTNGESLSIDHKGNIYMTGTTSSNSDIATSGAFQSVYGGSASAFLVKFGYLDNNAGIDSIDNPKIGICPGQHPIQVQLRNYGTANLDSVSLGWSINGKIQPGYHWIGTLSPDSSAWITMGPENFTSGKDTIKAWTSMPNGVTDSLPGNDSFITIIKVNPLPIANTGQSSYSICTGTHIKIGANAEPDLIYSWSSSPAGFSSTVADPVVNPSYYTVYQLSVTDTVTGCTDSNSASVIVSPLKAPAINPGNNRGICTGQSARIGSGAVNGVSYSWVSNPVGFTSTVSAPTVTPPKTTSYLLNIIDSQGCTNFDSVTITVNPRPVVKTGTSLVLCAGLHINLGAPPVAGYTYSWTSKPAGFFSNLSGPVDSPMVSTTYYLKETIAATGCMDSDSISFAVLPQPVAPGIGVRHLGGFEYRFNLENPDSMVHYTWNFGDSPSVHNAFFYDSIMYHTYAGNGDYNLTVEAIESHCVAYKKVPLSLNEQFSLNIYPNPFGLQANIHYTLANPGRVKISMTDDIGRNIGTLWDQQLGRGEYNTVFDGAAWKTRPGMYFILFQLDDKVIVKKIVQLDSIFY